MMSGCCGVDDSPAQVGLPVPVVDLNVLLRDGHGQREEVRARPLHMFGEGIEGQFTPK